jgi:hypothetical protein
VELEALARLQKGAGHPAGARRNKPPLSSSAASTIDRRFLSTVFNFFTEFILTN